jgi:hypothetical protein
MADEIFRQNQRERQREEIEREQAFQDRQRERTPDRRESELPDISQLGTPVDAEQMNRLAAEAKRQRDEEGAAAAAAAKRRQAEIAELRNVVKGCVDAQSGLVRRLAGGADPDFDAFVTNEGGVEVRGNARSRFTFSKCLSQSGGRGQ